MKVTVQEIETAFMRTGGVVGAAAAMLSVRPQTLYQRLARSDRLRRAKKSAEELVNDKAETNVIKSISEGDVEASKWWLGRRGVDRGFGAKKELTGPDGGPIALSFRSEEMSDEELKALAQLYDGARSGKGSRS